MYKARQTNERVKPLQNWWPVLIRQLDIMAENTTVREDHSNSEEDWDENIEQQTTEQQQTSQEHATHQQAQVQTTLNDDDDESEEYNLTAAGGAIRKTQTNVKVNRSTDEAKIQAEDGIRDHA